MFSSLPSSPSYLEHKEGDDNDDDNNMHDLDEEMGEEEGNPDSLKL